MTTTTLQHAEPNYGVGDKSLIIYIIGFVLCILLTLIPFATVMYASWSLGIKMGILLVSAIAQFFVQVICFLRLNVQTLQGKMNVMSFIFAIIVLFVVVGGSVWIMWNLNYNMMH